MLLGARADERAKGASYNLQLAPSAIRMSHRSSLQTGVRIAALVFVLAWLFVDRLQEWVPFWLPFVVLLATELEFVLRGRSEPRRTQRRRTPPGPEDADLGFGELVEDEEGFRWVPPPARPRPPRSRWVVRVMAALAVLVLFALAARTDRAGTWQALPREERTAAVKRFTSEAATIAGRPVTLRCDEQYDFTGAGSDTLGIAFPGAGIAYLDPSICRALHDLLADGKAGERQAEALVVLGEFSDPEKAAWIVVADVGLVSAQTDLDELPEALRRGRVYAGFSGWGPGQLEDEIEAGAWLVLDPDPNDLFTADPGDLWRVVLRRQHGRLSWLADAPDDLSAN